MSLEFAMLRQAFAALDGPAPRRCVCCGTWHADVKVRGGDLCYAEYCLACYQDEAWNDGEPCRHGQRPDEEE